MSAERVEGAAESSLFSLVDELTSRFKSKMAELGGPRSRSHCCRARVRRRRPVSIAVSPRSPPRRIEAYRYYAEGINYHERGLSSEAAPLLEKAIEIDPDFAMAREARGRLQQSRPLRQTRRICQTRAGTHRPADHAANATTSRASTTACGRRPVERSLNAYKQGLALHPEHQASRHNLGLHFIVLERFPEAIQQYRGAAAPRDVQSDGLREPVEGTHRDRQHPSRPEVAEKFVARYPENAAGLRMMGSALMADGRLDAARAAFEKSQALDPLDFGHPSGKASRRDTAKPVGRGGDGERGIWRNREGPSSNFSA